MADTDHGRAGRASSKNGALARAEREAEESRRQADAAARAEAIWREAPACDDHPYLNRKGVKPHGVRLSRGKLVVPVRDTEGKLHSLQFIGEDGGKKFLFGGRIKGGYFAIGKPGGVILIGEGYATCAQRARGHRLSGRGRASTAAISAPLPKR